MRGRFLFQKKQEEQKKKKISLKRHENVQEIKRVMFSQGDSHDYFWGLVSQLPFSIASTQLIFLEPSTEICISGLLESDSDGYLTITACVQREDEVVTPQKVTLRRGGSRAKFHILIVFPNILRLRVSTWLRHVSQGHTHPGTSSRIITLGWDPTVYNIITLGWGPQYTRHCSKAAVCINCFNSHNSTINRHHPHYPIRRLPVVDS